MLKRGAQVGPPGVAVSETAARESSFGHFQRCAAHRQQPRVKRVWGAHPPLPPPSLLLPLPVSLLYKARLRRGARTARSSTLRSIFWKDGPGAPRAGAATTYAAAHGDQRLLNPIADCRFSSSR